MSSGSSIEQERLNVEKERLVQEKRLALESTKSSCEDITQDLADLTTEFTEHFIWKDAEDYEVEAAMSNIKLWRARFVNAKRETIEVRSKIVGGDHQELTDVLTRLTAKVNKVEKELDQAISNIKVSDVEKGL